MCRHGGPGPLNLPHRPRHRSCRETRRWRQKLIRFSEPVVYSPVKEYALSDKPKLPGIAHITNLKTALVFWVLFALFISLPRVIINRILGVEANFIESLIPNLSCSVLVALQTPFMLWLSRRFSFSTPPILLSVAIHLLACIIFCLNQSLLYILVMRLVTPAAYADGQFITQTLYLMRGFFGFQVLCYSTIVAAQHAMSYLERSRLYEQKAARFREQLTMARLEVLQAKLQPHFLFNSLHTISSLVRLGQRSQAVDTIEEFGDLMRRSLDHGEQQLMPLRDELDFLRKYLNIEQRRFSDRLSVVWNVEPETLSIMLPALLMQPVLENAIRHGVEPTVRAVEVEIQIQRIDDHLEILIRDDGVGLPDGWTMTDGNGRGLANVQARLEEIYDMSHSFEIRPQQPQGTEALLRLPLSKSVDGITYALTGENNALNDSHTDRR